MKRALSIIAILILSLSATSDAKIVLMFKSYLPELPRSYVDTTYSTPGGSTIVVGDGGDFAAALTSANPGDIITLNAGSTYNGTFTLPVKSGSTYIYVVSSALVSLPAAGTRISLSDVANMPTIIGPSPGEPALNTAGNVSHHFRFVGIRFTSEAGESNNGLIRLGTGSETNVNQFPHHLIFDRCIVKGDTTTGGLRGVLFSGNYLAVVDSYVYDWWRTDTQCQGIVGWTGEGPWAIKNSYIEADAENFMAGGSSPLIENLVPSDIEVIDNLFSKPLTWNPNDASYDSIDRNVANIFELKNAQRVLITGNIFQRNWVDVQAGRAIVLTTKDQDGVADWTTVSDVTFKNNVLAGSHSGFSVSGFDGGFPSAGGQRILIEDNFLHDIGGALWGETGDKPSTIFNLSGGMRYVTIRGNTIIHGDFDADGFIINPDGAPYLDFRFLDNIIQHNTYGVKGPGIAIGQVTLDAYFPGCTFTNNVIVGAGANEGSYPLGNFFSATLADVKFENVPNDYRLDDATIVLSDLTTGLTAFFDFSSDATDSQGNNDLTAVNSPTFSAANGVDLEADSGQLLTINDNTDMSTGDIDWSFNLWFKPETTGTVAPHFGFFFLANKGWESDSSAQQEWGILKEGAGNPLAFYVTSGTTPIGISNTSGAAISDGGTYMVTVWHDATNNLIGIALNAGTADTVGHSAGVNDGNRQFMIGARKVAGVADYFSDGFFRRGAFYRSRVLTSQNRTDLYNNGSALSLAQMVAGVVNVCPYLTAATDGGPIGAPNSVIEDLP